MKLLTLSGFLLLSPFLLTSQKVFLLPLHYRDRKHWCSWVILLHVACRLQDLFSSHFVVIIISISIFCECSFEYDISNYHFKKFKELLCRKIAQIHVSLDNKEFRIISLHLPLSKVIFPNLSVVLFWVKHQDIPMH